MDGHQDRLDPLTFLVMLIILSALGYAAYESFVQTSRQLENQGPAPVENTQDGPPPLIELSATSTVQ